MLYKKIFIVGILATFATNYLWAETKTIELDELSGNWHLRIMDGMEVRKARAILDFDTKKMQLNGFDGCNRISGTLKKMSGTNMSSQLRTTKMACRESIHRYVSKRLHETVSEGFSITEATRNGVDGITLKSPSHELFFKRMGA
jgi:heat shock protein HslJ